MVPSDLVSAGVLLRMVCSLAGSCELKAACCRLPSPSVVEGRAPLSCRPALADGCQFPPANPALPRLSWASRVGKIVNCNPSLVSDFQVLFLTVGVKSLAPAPLLSSSFSA